jgi:hypothetical protein
MKTRERMARIERDRKEMSTWFKRERRGRRWFV